MEDDGLVTEEPGFEKLIPEIGSDMVEREEELVREDVFQLPTCDLSEVGDCTPLYAALVEAKLSMPQVLASSTGQYGSYADMADIAPVVDPHLAKHGLATITPFSGSADGECRITVILMHKSGCRLVANVAFAAMADIQKLGGQSTYIARYAYCKLLGIAAGDDPEKEIDKYDNQPRGQRQAPRPTQQRRPPASKGSKAADTIEDARAEMGRSITALYKQLGVKGRVAIADDAEKFLGKPTTEASVEELTKLRDTLVDRVADAHDGAQ